MFLNFNVGSNHPEKINGSNSDHTPLNGMTSPWKSGSKNLNAKARNDDRLFETPKPRSGTVTGIPTNQPPQLLPVIEAEGTSPKKKKECVDARGSGRQH